MDNLPPDYQAWVWDYEPEEIPDDPEPLQSDEENCYLN